MVNSGRKRGELECRGGFVVTGERVSLVNGLGEGGKHPLEV